MKLALRGLLTSGWLIAALAGGLVACGGDPVGSGSGSTSGDMVPQDPADQDWLERYAKVQGQAEQLGIDDFLKEYPEPEYVESLSYDPSAAAGLDAIEQAYPMTAAQQQVLANNGFVAMSDVPTSTFEETYHQVYFADLPVLITTDSVLYALHRSFDSILQSLELSALTEELGLMLTELHEGLEGSNLPAALSQSQTDLDVYLTVARRLLTEEAVPTLGGAANDLEVDRIMTAAAAEDVAPLDLFGVTVDYDFSQMKPRGHYEDDPVLQRYFRAMMWLGRTDLQMVYFVDGDPVWNRTAFDSAYVLDHLLTETGAMDRWARVDKVITTLIGEPDSMNPEDMVRFKQDSGLASIGDLVAASDEQVFVPLMAKRYGIQRIMSQVMYTDPVDPKLVLPRVYLLLGQRFTIDSHVYNNVTYDRVQNLQTGVKVTRMLPDELDVQFVLGSNHAAHLLKPELDQYGYQGILHEMRWLTGDHPQDFWEETFYSGWLAGIRALNATPQERDKYPEPMRTAAWADKALNTQAASRAELRHDTLLYVKQSYSGGIGCEYPDAYVEPAAAFYQRMAHLGSLGINMVGEIEAAGYDAFGAADYFTNWASVMRTLENIAETELAQAPLSGDQVAFLGQTIEQDIIGCGEVVYDGWYPSLFFDRDTVAVSRPTIADVHTAPTDEAGTPKGWVLHAATAQPMLMVMTVPACDGTSTAYVGPISSYHSVLTENFERKTDSQWAADLQNGAPGRPTWTQSFVP